MVSTAKRPGPRGRGPFKVALAVTLLLGAWPAAAAQSAAAPAAPDQAPAPVPPESSLPG